MAENDPAPAHARQTATATARTTKTEPETEEVEVNENYVGIDPIYANSAYEEPLNPEGADVPKGASDEEKKAAQEAAEAEVAMTERVKENEEACKVEMDEVVPYDEWVETSPDAERKATVGGVDKERAEADKAKTEEAKNEDGKIAPRSTSTHQPGVRTAN
jgi:hypothetical protein